MNVQVIAAASAPVQAAAPGKQGTAGEADGEAPVFGKMLGAASGRHHHVHPHEDAANPETAGEHAPHHAAGRHRHWRLLDALKGTEAGKAGGEEADADGDPADPKAGDAKSAEALGQVAAAVVQVQQAPTGRAVPRAKASEDSSSEDAADRAGAIVAAGHKDKHGRAEGGAGKQAVAGAVMGEAGRRANGPNDAQPPQPVGDAARVMSRDGEATRVVSQDGEPKPQAGSIVEGSPRQEPKAASLKEASSEHPAARVTVVSTQVAPAPAAPAPAAPITTTGADLVGKLAAGDALPRHIEAAAALDPVEHAAGRPVTTLKIQLHPVGLGTVTARLTGAGEHLAIEVQVDNHEARHRLQSDSDQIVKALRGMGYDIDRITVQQAPHTPAAPNAADGRGSGGGSFAAPDQRAGERQGQSFRQDTGQRQDEGRNPSSSGSGRSDSGGSVII